MKRNSDYKKKLAVGELEEIKHDRRTMVRAAVTIQKWWRGYASRLHMRERSNRLESILGMSIPSWRSREVFDKDEENMKRRHIMQPEYFVATAKATSVENARVCSSSIK